MKVGINIYFFIFFIGIDKRIFWYYFICVKGIGNFGEG